MTRPSGSLELDVPRRKRPENTSVLRLLHSILQHKEWHRARIITRIITAAAGFMLRVLHVPHSQASKAPQSTTSKAPMADQSKEGAGSVVEQATTNFSVKDQRSIRFLRSQFCRKIRKPVGLRSREKHPIAFSRRWHSPLTGRRCSEARKSFQHGQSCKEVGFRTWEMRRSVTRPVTMWWCASGLHDRMSLCCPSQNRTLASWR